MNTYVIKDYERCTETQVRAQGVAEAMFDYLPWHNANLSVTFTEKEGWVVIDYATGFKYGVRNV